MLVGRNVIIQIQYHNLLSKMYFLDEPMAGWFIVVCEAIRPARADYPDICSF